MNDKFIRDTLMGEEWMALRQIASGGKAGGIPQSAQTKLASLGLIERDHYGRMTLTEKGRRMIETSE